MSEGRGCGKLPPAAGEGDGVDARKDREGQCPGHSHAKPVSLLDCGIGSGRDRIATPHRPLRSPCSHASHPCDVTKDASSGSRSNSAKVARAQDLGTPQDLRTLQDSRTSSGPEDPRGPPHDLLKTPSGPQDHLRAPQYPSGTLRTSEPFQDCSGCPHIPKLPSVPCPMVASPFWQSPPSHLAWANLHPERTVDVLSGCLA